MNSQSANVLLSKAHAMYGRHLTPADLETLLSCSSVGEIAGSLKNEPGFAAALSDINERTVHRGYLEGLLQQKVYEEYLSIRHFDKMMGLSLLDPLLRSRDVDLIIRLLRLFLAGNTRSFIFDTPISRLSSLDVVALSQAKTYDDIVRALADSPFAGILARFAPDENGRLPLNEIEYALRIAVMKSAAEVVMKGRKTPHDELMMLWGARIVSLNAMRIWRMKKFFHQTPEQIDRLVFPGGIWISEKTRRRMIEAETPEEVEALYFTLPAGKKIPPENRVFSYNLARFAECTYAKHFIHFSNDPLTVLSAYLFLSENEVTNLVHIIEGCRYHIPVEQIRSTLVLV